MFNLFFKLKLNRLKKRGERYKQEQEIQDMYAEYLPERKRKKTSSIMLFVSVAAIVGYLLIDIYLQLTTGMELSPTITPYWFAFWTGEIFALAGIRIKKASMTVYDDGDYPTVG